MTLVCFHLSKKTFIYILVRQKIKADVTFLKIPKYRLLLWYYLNYRYLHELLAQAKVSVKSLFYTYVRCNKCYNKSRDKINKSQKIIGRQ